MVLVGELEPGSAPDRVGPDWVGWYSTPDRVAPLVSGAAAAGSRESVVAADGVDRAPCASEDVAFEGVWRGSLGANPGGSAWDTRDRELKSAYLAACPGSEPPVAGVLSEPEGAVSSLAAVLVGGWLESSPLCLSPSCLSPVAAVGEFELC